MRYKTIFFLALLFLGNCSDKREHYQEESGLKFMGLVNKNTLIKEYSKLYKNYYKGNGIVKVFNNSDSILYIPTDSTQTYYFYSMGFHEVSYSYTSILPHSKRNFGILVPLPVFLRQDTLTLLFPYSRNQRDVNKKWINQPLVIKKEDIFDKKGVPIYLRELE